MKKRPDFLFFNTKRISVIVSCLIILVFVVWQGVSYPMAEDVGSTTPGGATSRLKIISDILIGCKIHNSGRRCRVRDSGTIFKGTGIRRRSPPVPTSSLGWIYIIRLGAVVAGDDRPPINCGAPGLQVKITYCSIHEYWIGSK